MKKFCGLAIVFVFVLAGCGLSAEDEAAATAALGSISTLAQASRQIVADDAAAGRSCTEGSTTVGGITIATTCSGGVYTFSFSSSGEVSRTCGSTTVTMSDLAATITLTVASRLSWTYANDITATVNGKALDCNYGHSVTVGESTLTISSDGFDCTYDGSNVDADAIAAAACAT